MKKLIFIFAIVLSLLAGCGKKIEQPNSGDIGRFKLYKTQNMWNFLLLDTRTGRVWQSQYTLKPKVFVGSVVLSDVILANGVNDRFYLVETQNIWNFILVDSVDGRLWQCQFNVDDDNRFCKQIDGDEKNTLPSPKSQ